MCRSTSCRRSLSGPAARPEPAQTGRGPSPARCGSACSRTACAELTVTMTATAATNGKRQRPATAQDTRTIRSNLAYVRPETEGRRSRTAHLAGSSNEAGGSRYSKDQQRTLTATNTSCRPHPALAGTAANRPASPLVRDEEGLESAGPTVWLCLQGAGPAVHSRQPDAQRCWPGYPGPALPAPPARRRRRSPAHGSGGFAACEPAQPARSAATPDGQDLRSAGAVSARCCPPERWLPPTCGHLALML